MALAGPRHEPEPLPGVRQFRSPGLELVVERLRAGGKPHVLDLGSPRRAKLEFLSQTPCKILVEDLPHYLVGDTPPAADDAEEPDWDRYVRERLRFGPDTRLDVVLAWDLLSYLEPAVIRALMNAVAESSHEKTLLYITVSTAAGIGERPERVSVSPDGQIVYDALDPATRPNPGYSPVALERMMPGFRLMHSFMLGGDMQDYLFGYRGT